MKKIIAIAFALFLSKGVMSQGIPPSYESGRSSTTEKSGFDANRLFIGGNLNVGFGTGYSNFGANPEIGYSFSDWIDAGLAFNIGYVSQKSYDLYSGAEVSKISSFQYGAGLFARLYPFNGFFVQVQPENNWMNTTWKATGTGAKEKYNTSAASLLAGVGYSQRVVGQSAFYLAILFDVNKDQNSPYRNADGSYYPIIRAGFNFYLHPNR
ncbi:hypothetical protein SAMN05421788_10137 [Filimonas lacunae]|uniref:Outer membrane protein beta-barrel domain-containing protein n=1 Tax=Filimonas lacunae TaxID=477680 RepID=A0A173MLQ1_9BACT|nr:hypothetical protein [Filimonas lacunae]BAV08575.1 hypothetical protein FLA_4621 [Filimonas lacunae]SIS57464.1 hypothetical protein SAMN05421788_10137 [Filimonas lacunae]